MYIIKKFVDNKKICLNLHYNDDNSYLFANDKEIINLEAKESEIVPHPLCIRDISKDLPPPITNSVGLTGYIYDFSVDYWATANDKMLDIHKFLTKKNNIV